MYAKKVWERALKRELGPTLTWLLDEMMRAGFQSESSDFFLLDPPTSERLTSTAQQTKLGLFVLGRTSQGLFGVDRTDDGPLDSRPVFIAPFRGTERTHKASDLGEFLRGLEGFETFVAQHASKPMPKRTESAPVETSKVAAIPLTKSKAVALAREQIRAALQSLGAGVTLLVYEDDVACTKANALDVTLAINLPTSLHASLAEHAFVGSVTSAVQLHLAKATGYRIAMHIIFEPLDTAAAEHVKHLLALVKKTGDTLAEAFLKDATKKGDGPR